MKTSLYDNCMEQGREALLRQWHPTRNDPLTPETVTSGSKKKVWWICEKGHEWQAAVYSRTGAGSGCPYCAGKRLLDGENDLFSRAPDLAAQWHPTKNPGLDPKQLHAGGHKKVWWICEKGHEWQAQVNSRAAGAGCPVCTKRTILTGENDLSSTHPDLVAQWHPQKNGNLTPNHVAAGSIQKVWWQCENGHEWRASISSRASNGTGCPVCKGKTVVPGQNDLASIFPAVAGEWHPTKNGALSPDSVFAYSNKKVWWQCALGHEYPAVIATRTHRRGSCPYCTGRKVLPGFNDLATLEPAVAAQWHPDLNGALGPDMVTTGSQKKVWWQCSEGHVWKAVIYSRARGNKSGCPVCAGRVKEDKQERYRSMMTDL